MPGFSCNRDQLDLWRIDWVARGDGLSQGGQYVQCTWQCDNWNTESTWNDSFVLLFSLSYYFKVTWSESMCHIRAPEHTPTHSLGAPIMLTCLSSDITSPQHSRAKDILYISDKMGPFNTIFWPQGLQTNCHIVSLSNSSSENWIIVKKVVNYSRTWNEF